MTIEAKGIGTYTITLPRGNYNPTSLLLKTSSLFSVVGLSMLFEYKNPALEEEDNKYKLVLKGATGITITCGNAYLAHMVGIIDTSLSSTQTGNTWTSPVCLDFQSHNIIQIKSNIVLNNKLMLQEIIANDSPYNSSINYSCSDIQAYAKEIRTLDGNTLNIQVLDEENNLIDFNGNHIYLELLFFKTSNLDVVVKEFIKLVVENLKATMSIIN